jgi:hypothetical protein
MAWVQAFCWFYITKYSSTHFLDSHGTLRPKPSARRVRACVGVGHGLTAAFCAPEKHIAFHIPAFQFFPCSR